MHRTRRRAAAICRPLIACAAVLVAMAGCSSQTDERAAEPVLADTGPALPPRVPRSLTTAGQMELDLALRIVSGAIPPDARGHVYTIAALGNGPDAPVFNGDGMIYRLDFAPDGVQLLSSIAKTPSYYADDAIEDGPHAFKTSGLIRSSKTLGVRNQVNGGLIPLGDRLLAAHDVGRPYEVDPASLELVTPVGAQSEWRAALPPLLAPGPFPPVFTCARPAYDARTAELFSVNFGGGIIGLSPFADLVCWRGDGELDRWNLHLPGGRRLRIEQSVHELALSRDYIVIVDTAVLVEPDQFFDPNVIKPQSPDTHVYIVRRADLKQGQRRVEVRDVVIPREAVRVVADYDNPHDQIVLYLAHNCAADPSEWVRADDVRADNGQPVRADLVGAPVSPCDIGALGRHVIDAARGELIDSTLVFDEDHTWAAAALALPTPHAGRIENIYWVSGGYAPELATKRIVDVYRAYKYRRIALEDLPAAQKPATLFRLATADMRIADAFVLPTGRLAGAPVIIPPADAHSGRAGLLVCAVISDDRSAADSSGDEFWIFDADHLAQGPLCRLGHPDLDLGFANDSAWLAHITPRSSNYEVPVREDHARLLRGLPAEIRATFDRDVFPAFDADARAARTAARPGAAHR